MSGVGPTTGSASAPSTAREAILGRIRAAIGEGDARPALEPMPPSAPDDTRDLVARFAERVEDYRSTVTVVGAGAAGASENADEVEDGVRTAEIQDGTRPEHALPDAILRADSVAAAVAAACVRTGARRLGVPEGFDGDLVPDGVEGVPVMPGTREAALSFGTLDAVVCSAPLGIAETGTIVLDAGTGQGPRAASLLPDVLIVVIEASALVGGVVAAVDRMRSVVIETARPLTMISGPSATSDIELDRVEGVHGPRTLEVIVVDAA